MDWDEETSPMPPSPSWGGWRLAATRARVGEVWRHNEVALATCARTLTPQERALWTGCSFAPMRADGLHFRRQAPIGAFHRRLRLLQAAGWSSKSTAASMPTTTGRPRRHARCDCFAAPAIGRCGSRTDIAQSDGASRRSSAIRSSLDMWRTADASMARGRRTRPSPLPRARQLPPDRCAAALPMKGRGE